MYEAMSWILLFCPVNGGMSLQWKEPPADTSGSSTSGWFLVWEECSPIHGRVTIIAVHADAFQFQVHSKKCPIPTKSSLVVQMLQRASLV